MVDAHRALAAHGTAGRRWRLSLATLVLIVAASGVAGLVPVVVAGRDDDRVAAAHVERAVAAEALRGAIEQESAAARAFLLTGDEAFIERSRQAHGRFRSELGRIHGPLDGVDPTVELEAALAVYEDAVDRVFSLRRDRPLQAERPSGDVRTEFERDVVPAKHDLDAAILQIALRSEHRLAEARQEAAAARSRSLAVASAVASAAVVLATTLALLLRRSLRSLASERAALATSLAAMERSNRDLDAFAGRVAHDLRNALAPLLMGTQLLRVQAGSREHALSVCARLDRAVQRATALVDALLAFSRADATADRDAAASVRATVDEVLDQLAPQLALADARVTSRVTDEYVACPPGLLQIVLSNVVGNAVKFVRDEPVRRLTISSRRLRDGCEIRVDDTGPGIPEASRARIFEPFFRVSGTRAPGTGIGLATVRRILDAHGGRIDVTSAEGGGSTFAIWLPLAGDDAAGVEAEKTEDRRDARLPV
jgi:signal transduction histidine kinase